ncbi:hypothetical protein Lgee_2168 [Legionella geestiana]|uniref:Uncharacterized protein n=1 Tax=Legionella geestiana TaxID=45065 RepID=A0A0W0TMN9_9GAMM|nr:hypothetical protein [Legionella geestiana]KTC96485.1 hypothetical protein Lgee_2168 [Legionella geestiana]QBS12527.1 hypothetical protein E4T54_07045 [Legionella geestiana]QDQ39757.1 hypothetical protein E3226_004805 [Legionella geestiana]STX55027.1 Uncharacterised protein [Legionella geestiana]
MSDDKEVNQADEAEETSSAAPSKPAGSDVQKNDPRMKYDNERKTAKGDYADIMSQATDELVNAVSGFDEWRNGKIVDAIKGELNEYADELKDEARQMYSDTKEALKSLLGSKDEDAALEREQDETEDADMSQARSMMSTPGDSPAVPFVEMSGLETQRLDEQASSDAEAIAGPAAGAAVEVGNDVGKAVMTGG